MVISRLSSSSPLRGYWRIPPGVAVLIAALSAIVATFGRLPLAHVDLWGHLAWGRWIFEHHRLPATEPFMPLARGVEVVDTAWLSQLGGYAVHAIAGVTGLQLLHGVCIALCCAALVGAVRGYTRSPGTLLVAITILLATQWYQWQILRPQLAGQVAYMVLVALIAAAGRRRPSVALVAVLFLLWANLHGSFVMGIALLGLSAIGRGIDVAVRTRNASTALHDRLARKLGIMAFVAALAALLNPYGVKLYREVLLFARNPNLRDLLEWAPLHFNTWQGRLFVAAGVLLLLAGIAAPRNVRWRDWLPMLAMGLATVVSARFIVWWGPLAACCVAAQFGAWGRRHFTRHAPSRVSTRSAIWTIASAVAILAAFATTPLARRLATGTEPPVRQGLSRRTPIAAVAWLRDNPPAGQVFNSYEWGDYLIWAGPPQVGVFVTSQVHCVPPLVWRDYREISRGASGWQARLDRYEVTTALIDLRRHPRLADRLAKDNRWEKVYSDRQAAIFARRN